MNKRKFLLIPFVLLWLSTTQIFSQGAPFKLIVNVYNLEPLNALFISDLNVFQQELEQGNQEIFSLYIQKLNNDSYDQARMIIQISRDNQSLIRWQSEYFKIPGDPQGAVYETDNIELSNNQFYFSFDEGGKDPATRVRFVETELADDIENLKNKVLASGKAPVGQYKLSVTLKSPEFGTTEEVKEEITLLNAVNPSYVQLIAPGSSAGYGMSPEVYTEYPVFQWNGNGDEYEVVVFEKRSALQSFDDIINSQPVWQSSRLENRLTVQYPQAGNAVPLEYGNTYYWMVYLINRTSSGEERIPSEVWQFKLVDPSQISNQQDAMAREAILSFLEQQLGYVPENIKQKLGDADLQTISFNGKKITVEELYQILNQYQTQEVEIFDLFFTGQ